MKFNFNSNLSHQIDAIKSIIDIFENVKTRPGIFSLNKEISLFNVDSDNYYECYGNKIATLNWKEIISKNIKKIQYENGIDDNGEFSTTFDIEMETGTGKTYVYLRTIIELYQNYGFNKFIILVPSIAIKEGVIKTYNITKQHFKNLFSGVQYRMFEYDGSRISNLYDFFTSNNLEIMIMTVQSINKTSNNIYEKNDKLNGYSGIELISKTNPIIIIDEPQTTSSTDKSNEAINKLNPLFKIRYSATFRKRKNEKLMYKLDAIDAHEKKLVKRIVVHGSKVEDPYSNELTLIKVDNEKIFLNVYRNNKNKKVVVYKNDDLFEATELPLYKNKFIQDIVSFDTVILNDGSKLKLEKDSNSRKNIEIKQSQIEKTIIHHLDKQLELIDKNIKVLSLFFIDEVKNYRVKKSSTETIKGDYYVWFESIFKKIILENHKYHKLYDPKMIDDYLPKIHGGYFSGDKKFQTKDSTGKNADDVDTYKIIMQDKEKLLSINEPLSFIFSHTALREGWDNPNVFVICTLNSTNSEIKKRQEIGRGLRLCVDSSGNRVIDENINELIIVANESYEKFAEELQNEFREDGLRFNVFDKLKLRKILINYQCDDKEEFLWNILKTSNIIDENNIVTNNVYDDNLIEDIKSECKNLISDYILEHILNYLKLENKNIIKNYDNKQDIVLNKKLLEDENFIDFWNFISQKTFYKLSFTTKELIEKSIETINSEHQEYRKIYLYSEKQRIDINKDGVKSEKLSHSKKVINDLVEDNRCNIYEVVDQISEKTNIKRATIYKILISTYLNEYINKIPNYCIEKATNGIIKTINKLSADNIQYYCINDSYKINKFENNIPIYETSDLNVIIKNKDKTIYNIICCDSNVEKKFLIDTDLSDDIRFYIKFPNWYKIQTPIGGYNPDWGLYSVKDKKIIVETKGSTDFGQLRISEEDKINYGKKHFNALNGNIKFQLVSSFDELDKE
ncbi:restriction endonuclease [Malacoplasma iowae]|uniref:DEAD/DEAH box helicase family protein n=1 Tax=Malacoplasma iowae 695 TaxID=1048830 RepID=A0A6P1LAI2_MALIO|nr:DEAD/DEAH box helicase family protein [Malacoplasma iowae]VEU62894.1 type III restriction-modification system StyLTI enzyme res [Mycoplasmopsis fermentans]EGZ31716.1 type III restriction protein res subunit [Malacoplasma iowae 695]QHG89436.1 DEAD/DEAH box helicase family protein [Malacoplasma iowae 695]WPL35843.1 DEAD/DEAH box helicase family protein [Malacoplasma iowae]VEU71647.1 type III restriction-modification system StyLTI enzyme res [Malacoplasma iowae]